MPLHHHFATSGPEPAQAGFREGFGGVLREGRETAAMPVRYIVTMRESTETRVLRCSAVCREENLP